jgi:hypothetical protein
MVLEKFQGGGVKRKKIISEIFFFKIWSFLYGQNTSKTLSIDKFWGGGVGYNKEK